MNQSADLLPGTLGMLILKTVSVKPLHGYGVLLRVPPGRSRQGRQDTRTRVTIAGIALGLLKSCGTFALNGIAVDFASCLSELEEVESASEPSHPQLKRNAAAAGSPGSGRDANDQCVRVPCSRDAGGRRFPGSVSNGVRPDSD